MHTPSLILRSQSENTREIAHKRDYELSEYGMPTHDGTRNATKSALDFLDVENHKNVRYHHDSGMIFPQVYVHDFCAMFSAYFPLVWWTKDALLNRRFDSIIFGKNFKRMECNDLYDWFKEWGGVFGWREIDTTEGQIRANQGECVVMVAAHSNRAKSGHMVIVVPETEDIKCLNVGGAIPIPVMSQASLVNKKYFSSKWWNTYERPRVYVHKK